MSWPMFEGLTRFFGKLRAPKSLPAVLEEYEAGRRHPVLPPLVVALGEFEVDGLVSGSEAAESPAPNSR